MRLHTDDLVVDNFAGGGGASLGIEMDLGRSPDIAVNHDPLAVALHAENHPSTQHFCESVWDVDPTKVTSGRAVALAWFSPDCFPAGTMVLTHEGYRPIEQIVEGDLVFTHRLRWQRVTSTMRSMRPLQKIAGRGHPGLLVSSEHPFYARFRSDVWNNDLHRYERVLKPAEWIPASSMDRGWYWASPTSFPSCDAPDVPVVRQRTLSVDDRLMWLAGLYVADGWTRLTTIGQRSTTIKETKEPCQDHYPK